MVWRSWPLLQNEPTIASLCKEIDALRAERLTAQRGAVTFKHVRGHSGDLLNERADKLATTAIERLRGTAHVNPNMKLPSLERTD